MTNTAILSLGSNINAENNIVQAVHLLTTLGQVKAKSSVWQTKPLGKPNQPYYLNAAVLLETLLSPTGLKDGLHKIEMDLGRTRGEDKFTPRTIDIDIMLWNEEHFQLGNRTVPDKEIYERAFVAIPIAQIAPDFRHPLTGETMTAIANTFTFENDEMSIRSDIIL